MQERDTVRTTGALARRLRSSTALTVPGRLLPVALTCAAMLAAGHAGANPVGEDVVSGTVSSIDRIDGTTTINQTSNKAIINWTSFDIDAGQATHFDQPDASSITLNRVIGDGDPLTNDITRSFIDGNLTADGHVWLVNPNGIAFGNNAVVDVQGLVATTANITDDDFDAGVYDFAEAGGNPDAKIVNAGKITVGGTTAAEAGLAALVGPGVENTGTITAEFGTVTLAGTSTFKLDMSGGLFGFALAGGAEGMVTQSGKIDASSGRVRLGVDEASAVIDQAINVSGIVQASMVEVRGDTIVLAGSDANGLTADTLVLDAAETVSQTGDALIAATNLAVEAGTGATMIHIDADTVAAKVTGAGGFSLTDTDGLTVGSVVTDPADPDDSSDDVTLNGIDAGTGALTLAAGGTLDLNAGVKAGTAALAATSINQDAGAITATTLDVTTTGGSADLTRANKVGTLTANITGGSLSFTNNQALKAGAIDATGNNVTLTTTADDLTLSANVSAVDVIVNAAGAILQTGGTVTATDVTFDADGGVTQSAGAAITATTLDVTSTGTATLTAGTNLIGTLTANVAGGDLSFTNGKALETGAVSAAGAVDLTTTGGGLTLAGGLSGASVSLDSAAGITQTGGITTAGMLGITADGPVDLTSAANSIGTLTATVTGGDLSFTNGQALAVGGISATGGDVTLTATGGGITQSGGISTGGLGVTAGGPVALTGAGNSIDTLTATVTGGGLSFTNGKALETGAIDVASNVALTTTAGDLTLAAGMSAAEVVLIAAGGIDQTGGTISAGRLGLEGQSIDILSTTGVDTFAANVTGAGESLSFSAGGPLTIGSVGTIGGVTADGDITIESSGALTVDAAGGISGGGSIRLAAGNGALTVDGVIDGGSGTVRLDAGETGEATNATLTIGADVTGGMVVLRSDDGVVQQASTTISAGRLGIEAANSTALLTSGVGTIAADISGTGGFGFAGGQALTIGTVDGIAGIRAGGGTIAVGTAVGDLTVSRAVDAGAAGTVRLTADDNLTLDAGITAQTVALNAGMAINQSGGLISATGLFVGAGTGADLDNVDIDALAANVASGAFSLLDAGDLAIGTVDGVDGVTAGGDVTIGGGTGTVSVDRAIVAGTNEVRLSGGAIALGAGVTAGRAVLTATGAVTQTAGTIAAAELGVKGDSIDTLATSGVEEFAANVTGTGGLTLADDAGGLTIGEVGGISGITADGGTVSVTTTGGALTVANAVSSGIGTGTVSLSSQGAGAGIAVGANIAADGLTLNSAGGVSQTDGTVIDAGTLGVTAAGDVDLTSTANLVDQLIADAGSADFAFANGKDLTVGADGVKTAGGVIGLSAAGDLTVDGAVDSGAGGTIVLETTGALRQGDAGSFRAAALGLRAATTDGLSLPDIDVLAVDLTGNGTGFTHADADGLTIGTVAGVGGMADIAGIKTNNGAVDISTEAGNLTVADAVTAGSAAVTLRATGGDLDLADDLTAGTATLEALGAIDGAVGAMIDADELRLRGGTIGLAGTQEVGRLDAETTAAGDLDFANDGDLVLDRVTLADGKASIRTVSGDLTLAGDVSATEAVLDSAGALKQTGGTIAAARLGARGRSIAALDTTGVTTFAADVTGAGKGLSFTGTGPLTIGTVGGIAGVTTEGGTIQVVGTGRLTIDAAVDAGEAAVALTAGGGDSLLAANARIAGAGGVTLRADRMALNGAVDAGAGVVALAPATAGTTIALGASGDAAGAGLRLSDAELDRIAAGALRIGSAAAGGITVAGAIGPAGTDTLSLVTGGGVGQGPGAAIDVGRLAVAAGDTVDLDASNAIDMVAARSTAGDVSIANGEAMTVGSVDGVDGVAVSGTRTIRIAAEGDLTLDADITGHRAVLSSTAGIVQPGGEIVVDALDVTSRDDTALDRAGNRVGALAATVTGPGSDLTFIGSTGFLTNGATAVDGSVTLRAENGTLTVGGDIGAGSGDAELSATDDIVFHPGVEVSAAGDGLVTMDAGGRIRAQGDLTVKSGRGFTLTSDFVGAGGTTFDADHDSSGAGRFAIAAGRTVSNAGALTIVARDVDIGSGGGVRAGSATIRPSRDNIGLAIGDGVGTGGAIGLSGAELAAFRTGVLSLHGTGSAAIGVGEVSAGEVGGIGLLSLAGGGAVSFGRDFNGGVDLYIQADGDVTFHEDVGTSRRLGDVTFAVGGDVAIEKMFVAGDMTVDIGGDFYNINQAIRLNQALGLDVDSLYIENARSFEAFGTVGGRHGRAVALVIGTRERSNEYTANGCIVGDLTSCANFGIPLPTARLDLSRDLDELFTTEEEEDEERDDLLFSNGGNEELW